MPLPSKYPNPKLEGLGNEVRHLLADVVGRISTRLDQARSTDATNLKALLTAVITDLDAIVSGSSVIGTITVSGDNSVSVAEKASPVPVVAPGLTNIKAGDTVKVEILDASGAVVTSASSAALSAGATTSTVNVTLTSQPAANYTAKVSIVRNGMTVYIKSQAFVIAAV